MPGVFIVLVYMSWLSFMIAHLWGGWCSWWTTRKNAAKDVLHSSLAAWHKSKSFAAHWNSCLPTYATSFSSQRFTSGITTHGRESWISSDDQTVFPSAANRHGMPWVDLVSDPKLLILHSHRHGVFQVLVRWCWCVDGWRVSCRDSAVSSQCRQSKRSLQTKWRLPNTVGRTSTSKYTSTRGQVRANLVDNTNTATCRSRRLSSVRDWRQRKQNANRQLTTSASNVKIDFVLALEAARRNFVSASDSLRLLGWLALFSWLLLLLLLLCAANSARHVSVRVLASSSCLIRLVGDEEVLLGECCSIGFVIWYTSTVRAIFRSSAHSIMRWLLMYVLVRLSLVASLVATNVGWFRCCLSFWQLFFVVLYIEIWSATYRGKFILKIIWFCWDHSVMHVIWHRQQQWHEFSLHVSTVTYSVTWRFFCCNVSYEWRVVSSSRCSSFFSSECVVHGAWDLHSVSQMLSYFDHISAGLESWSSEMRKVVWQFRALFN